MKSLPKDLMAITFYMTDFQSEEIKKLYKRLDCEDVNDFFNKMLEFSKAMADMNDKGWECITFDKSQTKMMKNKTTGEVVLHIKDKESYNFFTEEAKEIVQIKKNIAKTNGWGQPFDPIKA